MDMNIFMIVMFVVIFVFLFVIALRLNEIANSLQDFKKEQERQKEINYELSGEDTIERSHVRVQIILLKAIADNLCERDNNDLIREALDETSVWRY